MDDVDPHMWPPLTEADLERKFNVDLEFDTRECRHYSCTLHDNALICDDCATVISDDVTR